jgi:hypothetical protein
MAVGELGAEVPAAPGPTAAQSRVWQQRVSRALDALRDRTVAAQLLDLLTSAGDILIRGADAVERLGIGALGQVLMVGGAGLPTWATPAGLANDTLWDAAGDLVVGTGPNAAARLPASDNGKVLRLASGTPAWQDDCQYAYKSGDQTLTSGTLADVTDMGFAVAANGVYTFEYFIAWRASAAVATGLILSTNGPGATAVTWSSEIQVTGTAGTDQYHSAVINAYGTTHSPGTGAGTTNQCARIVGMLRNGGSAGTHILRAARNSNNVIIAQGSWGRLRRLA